MSADAAVVPFARDRTLVGVALFIASESLFFIGVIAAYVVFREQGLATARAQLDVGRTALFSVLLFASSGTVGLAAARRSRAWLALTALLGAAFLAGQGLEYARLLGAGLRPGSELFGTTFFTLTGLHAIHVLVGLVLLGTLFVASSARPRRVGHAAWEGIAMYWHFVDAVWIVVFSVVYLGTVAG
ncbi:MAG TPA: cytochrome c oxidase subunit 3 [Candidatus Limnocylindria bacterium]|nr:cytochrome c oxidase subunit 3 [Candidatus Limnocylindria bacterium]